GAGGPRGVGGGRDREGRWWGTERLGCGAVSRRARGADARPDARPKRGRCRLDRRAAQATTPARHAGGRPVPSVHRGTVLPPGAEAVGGGSSMTVAAYQCRLFLPGSMGASDLIRTQGRACETEGTSRLCT